VAYAEALKRLDVTWPPLEPGGHFIFLAFIFISIRMSLMVRLYGLT
jgi:hypothetical protein